MASLPFQARRAYDAGLASANAGRVSEALALFRKAVQTCDEDRSFAPNMAFVECLRATAQAYDETEAPNHPGAMSHVERALNVARSLGPTTDPEAVKLNAICEALLSKLYLRQGRTTESLAAADRGRALLVTPRCMDISVFL